MKPTLKRPWGLLLVLLLFGCTAQESAQSSRVKTSTEQVSTKSEMLEEDAEAVGVTK